MEVQAHGFTWEKQILAIYGATPEEMKSIKYTSKMDLPAQLNRINQCDLSIKTTGTPNSVCMADCLRVYDEVEKGFNLVVVQYKQIGLIKQVAHIVEIDLSGSRQILFGDISRNEIEELDSAVKSVPSNRKPTSEEYKHMYAIRDELQKRSGAIRFDIKCNSTQSRLQCSFNKFQSFLTNNPTKIIAKSDTSQSNKFYNGSITHQIQSSPRKFKPKTNL
jgi:hypothetical protein